MESKKPRVLVVEDDALHARVVQDALAPLEVDAVYVTSAEDALAAALHQMPDIVLADHVLPGRSGLDLLAELGVQHRQPLRVLLTARPEVRAPWGQDIAVLWKPFRVNTLQWLVRELSEYVKQSPTAA